MKKAVINTLCIFVYAALMGFLFFAFDADVKFSRAKALEDAFRWDAALVLYEEAAAGMPVNAEYRSELGNMIIKRGVYRDEPLLSWAMPAKKAFMAALRFNPYSAQYAERIGGIEARLALDAPGTVGVRFARRAMRYLMRAYYSDPNGPGICYAVGITAVSLWRMISPQERQWALDCLRYAYAARTVIDDYIYPYLWTRTGSFGALEYVTPDTLEANLKLFDFIKRYNLWELRKQQSANIERLRQTERPGEAERLRRVKEAALETVSARGVPEGLSWRGIPAAGADSYVSGNMYWAGTIYRLVELPVGETVIRIAARGDRAFGVWPYMVAELDGKEIGEAFVDSPEWKTFEFRADTPGGYAVLGVTFVNDICGRGKGDDRNLYVGDVAIGQ